MIAAAGLLAVWVASATGVAGSPASGMTSTVKAELISHEGSLGVRFIIPRGKHIYWSNPGDAGLPTQVTVTLPAGFRAGPLRWPVPGKFVQPGDITGYGYERELLLWVPIEGRAGGLPAGSKVGASVKWLECDDRECVSGSARLEATWPVAGIPNAFARWESRMPESGGTATATTAGTAGRWELAIPWARRRGSVRWVAASDPRVAVTDVEVTPGDPVRIRCTVAAAPGSRLPAGGVEVLVAYKGAWSEMKAVSVEVPAR